MEGICVVLPVISDNPNNRHVPSITEKSALTFSRPCNAPCHRIRRGLHFCDRWWGESSLCIYKTWWSDNICSSKICKLKNCFPQTASTDTHLWPYIVKCVPIFLLGSQRHCVQPPHTSKYLHAAIQVCDTSNIIYIQSCNFYTHVYESTAYTHSCTWDGCTKHLTCSSPRVRNLPHCFVV